MDFRRHSFPDFQDKQPVPAKDPSDPRLVFKPVFGQSCLQSDAEEAIKMVEQAHSQSYACGLEEGREEGCRMAKSGLSPCLSQFGSAYDDMAALIPALSETIAEQVTELAHGLCERILGKQMDLATQDLKSLRAGLIDKVSAAQRLAIHFHPEDYAAIEDLAGSVDCQWPEGCDQVSLVKDPGQTQGQVTLHMPGHSSGECSTGNLFDGSVEDLAELVKRLPRSPSE